MLQKGRDGGLSLDVIEKSMVVDTVGWEERERVGWESSMRAMEIGQGGSLRGWIYRVRLVGFRS